MAGQTARSGFPYFNDQDVTDLGDINATGFERIDDALNKTPGAVDCSGASPLTLDDFGVNVWNHNRVIKLGGTPAGAFTLKLPNRGGVKYIRNVSGQTVTLDTVAGSAVTPTIPTGSAAEFSVEDDLAASPPAAEIVRLTANQANS